MKPTFGIWSVCIKNKPASLPSKVVGEDVYCVSPTKIHDNKFVMIMIGLNTLVKV